MPVLALAGSDLDTSRLSGHLHGGHSLTSHFGILVGAGVAIITALFLLQNFVLPWFSRKHPQRITRGSLWTGPASKVPPRGISRGETSGTAPAGLGGSVEGSSFGTMEEKESTAPAGAWSRGVSSLAGPGTAQESSGLSNFGRIFPAAAAAAEGQSDHARISPPSHTPSPLGHAGGASVGSAERGKDSMDDDGYSGRHSRPGSVVAASRSTTPFFGQPEDMADGGPGPVPAIGGRPSWRRPTELNFTRPSLAAEPVYFASRPSFEARIPPSAYAQSVPAGLDTAGAGFTRLTDPRGSSPGYIGAGTTPVSGPSGAESAGFSANVAGRRNHNTKGIPIPPTIASDTQGPWEVDGQIDDAGMEIRSGSGSGQGFTASSYPSTSPLLPPPPPTMDHHFDLSQIMFPGPGAVDGGVRVVQAEQVHNHGEDGFMDAHEATIGTSDDSGTGWKRHTRVYGGGVCLACAAAGGGGFYGARVRPEDKR